MLALNAMTPRAPWLFCLHDCHRERAYLASRPRERHLRFTGAGRPRLICGGRQTAPHSHTPADDPSSSSCCYQPISRGKPHLRDDHSSRAYQQVGPTMERTIRGKKGTQPLSGDVRGWLRMAYYPHQSRQASQNPRRWIPSTHPHT